VSIGNIRNTLLRRVALVTYVPAFVLGCIVIGVLQWAHDVMLATVDGIHAAVPEIRDCAKLIRDVWRGR
jgi:hypothetical protein